MAKYDKVCIDFTINDIKGFSPRVSETLDAMSEIYKTMEEACGRAEKYIDDSLANAAACENAYNEEKNHAENLIPGMRDFVSQLQARADELRDFTEKNAQLKSSLYDQYKRYCAEQTSLAGKPPSQNGKDEASQKAYEREKKLWLAAKQHIDKAVAQSYSEYTKANAEQEKAYTRLNNCNYAIDRARDYINKIQDIIADLQNKISELQKLKEQFSHAKDDLGKAWSSFYAGYSRAESNLNDLNASAQRALIAACSVAENISRLGGSGVDYDERIAFNSVSKVGDCAEDLRQEANRLELLCGNASGMNSFYSGQIDDPVMRGVIDVSNEISNSFRNIGSGFSSFADELFSLAESLSDYMNSVD